MSVTPGGRICAMCSTRSCTSRRPVVFRGWQGDLIEFIWWNGQGARLSGKRPEKCRFVWPAAKEGKIALTPAQLAMLQEGIDWRLPLRTWRPSTARRLAWLRRCRRLSKDW